MSSRVEGWTTLSVWPHLCSHAVSILGVERWDGGTQREVKVGAQGHRADKLPYTTFIESRVIRAGTEGKEGEGFCLAAQLCSRREARHGRVPRQTGSRMYARVPTGSRLWEAEGQWSGLHNLQPKKPEIRVSWEGLTGQISEDKNDFQSSAHHLCRQLSPLPPPGLGLDFFQPMHSRTEHPVIWVLRKRIRVIPDANTYLHSGRSLLQVWKQNMDSVRG